MAQEKHIHWFTLMVALLFLAIGLSDWITGNLTQNLLTEFRAPALIIAALLGLWVWINSARKVRARG